jgi:hypothetical protein
MIKMEQHSPLFQLSSDQPVALLDHRHGHCARLLCLCHLLGCARRLVASQLVRQMPINKYCHVAQNVFIFSHTFQACNLCPIGDVLLPGGQPAQPVRRVHQRRLLPLLHPGLVPHLEAEEASHNAWIAGDKWKWQVKFI